MKSNQEQVASQSIQFNENPSARRLDRLRQRIEFGDLALICYVAVFVRSYLWGVGDNYLAWSLTVLLTLAVWCGYLYSKESTDERPSPLFWFVVAAPLVFAYALRVAFPDLSYDVMNYRLVHAERGLRGFLFIPGDFFPTIFPLNPAPDMLTGIYRHLLGYRLGTIGNLIAMLWTGEILYKMLRECVTRVWLRSVCVLLILTTEQVLFAVNTYMMDVLTVPLLLEATRLALDFDLARMTRARVAYFAFLLGASIAFKVSNAIYVLPILLLCFYKIFVVHTPRTRGNALRLLVFAVAFTLPWLMHAAWLYIETGNPIFPLYNNVFRSPYWVIGSIGDGRWGAKGAWETLLWAVLIFFQPERGGEIGVYSGRLSLGFAVALVCLVVRHGRRLRALALLLLCGVLLWSLGSGYTRYALFSEVLAGLVVVQFAAHLWMLNASRVRASLRVVCVVLACMLVAQFAAAANYARLYEWSMRPTLFDDYASFLTESRHLLSDRAAAKFLPAESQAKLRDVEVWVVSEFVTNGVEVMLKPEIPMVAVENIEYSQTAAANLRYSRTLDELASRKMYSLCYTKNLEICESHIRQSGLRFAAVTPFNVPFFSVKTTLDMQLIRLRPMRADESDDILNEQPPPPPPTPLAANSPPTPFAARIAFLDAPTTLRAGQRAIVRARIENQSAVTWRNAGDASGAGQINLGNHWLDRLGRKLINDDGRVALPADLMPGASVEVQLEITAPAQPGEYLLELDLVQEHVAWFRDKGAPSARSRIRIER